MSNVQSAAYRSSSRSSRREEEEEEEEEDLQTNIGAGYHDLSVNNDNRYTESQRRLQQQQIQQRESESRVTGGGRTGQVYYAPGGSTSSSYRSSAQNSEAQYQETRTQKPVPVGQYVSMAVRPGTSTVLTVPVSAQDTQGQQRVYASNRQGYQAVTESSRTRVQPGYQINYYPSYASERTASLSSGSRVESVTQKIVPYQPERTTAASYTRSRYNTEEIDEDEEEDTQQRVQQANINSRQQSTSGSSTNYQQSYTGRAVPAVPVVPVHTVESTSSQRTSDDQRTRYYQSRPVYSQNQRVTSNRNENEQASGSSTQYTSVNRPVVTSSRISGTDGSQYGSSGVTYYTAPVSSQSRVQMQAQNQAGSAAQTQYTSGIASQNQYASGSSAQNQYAAGTGSRTSGYGYQAYPQTQSRFSGSQRGSASLVNQQSLYNAQAVNANSDDLIQYMSESEKLAREQQRQIAGSSQSSSSQLLTASDANRRTVNTANTLDSAAANFVGSTNLQSRLNDFDNVESLGGSGTGFKRVKSWQKQSKWASGK